MSYFITPKPSRFQRIADRLAYFAVDFTVVVGALVAMLFVLVFGAWAVKWLVGLLFKVMP